MPTTALATVKRHLGIAEFIKGWRGKMEIKRLVEVLGFLSFIAIFLLMFYVYNISASSNEIKPDSINTNITEGNWKLEKIVKSEIVSVPNWTCLDYATYYNKTFKEKYPELDVRWPRYVDICNNFTLCDDYHTFLIIGGYGGEILLDQGHYAAVRIIHLNETFK